MVAEGKKKGVEVSKGFEYLETRVNPRRVPYSDESGKKLYRHASYSDINKSEHYPIFTLQSDDLASFGIGIALYFKQLKWLSLAFFVYGIIMTWSAYNHSLDGDSFPGLIPGSAICSDYEVVDAVNCPEGVTCEYAPSCDLSFKATMCDFIGVAWILLYCVMISHMQSAEEEKLDTAVQTATDYSLVVEDPDHDADDPEEWNNFFSQWGEVAYITIARANSKLLTKLTLRRFIRFNYEDRKDVAESSSSLPKTSGGRSGREEASPLIINAPAEGSGSCWTNFFRSAGLKKDVVYWGKKLDKINQEIEKLEQEYYPVTRVYCVFNEEKGQRACLNDLTTGAVQAAFEHPTENKAHMFRGTNVLSVKEPVEPDEVLWWNLELGWRTQAVQSFVSAIITLGVVAASFYTIYTIKEGGTAVAAQLSLVVTFINLLLPTICKTITSMERHYDAGDAQDSLMFKLLCSRLMNSTLINFFTTASSATLFGIQIKAIQALMISDAFMSPTITIMDMSGTMKRRVFSHFAPSQRVMLVNFLGSPWDLAERYTSMAKTVFVALFYSAIFPQGLLFAGVCFLYTYFCDRYRLFHLWQRPPQYNAQLAAKTVHIVTLSLLAHLVVTTAWFAQWPFDSAYSTTDSTGEEEIIYANKLDEFKGLALSNVATITKYLFLITPTWMTKDQSSLVIIYVWIAVVFGAILAVYYGLDYFKGLYTMLFVGDYDACGHDVGVKFSDVDEKYTIHGYFPMCVPGSPLVGQLSACHVISANPKNFPRVISLDHEEPEAAFHRLNVSYEFPEDVRYKLFGIVQCFLGDDQVVSNSELQRASSTSGNRDVLQTARASIDSATFEPKNYGHE